LYALSKHYEIPVAEIQRVNKLNGTIIKIGQELMIPAIKDVAKFTGAKQYEKVVFNGKHKVTEKDTLWNLSLKYNVQVEVLAEENNMKIDDILRIGSSIKVPIIE
jgi:membrane-bound lytic murein transglycosylase D